MGWQAARDVLREGEPVTDRSETMDPSDTDEKPTDTDEQREPDCICDDDRGICDVSIIVE
jgi:hypothetical protein